MPMPMRRVDGRRCGSDDDAAIKQRRSILGRGITVVQQMSDGGEGDADADGDW